MMTGWVFVVLSSVSSVLIAHFLKMTEYAGLNTIRVLTVNYAIASLVAFGTADWGDPLSYSGATDLVMPLLIMLIAGLLFIGNFFLFSRSVARNGMGISVSSMRLSLLIPVLISVFWYGEWLTSWQWFSMILLFAALYMMLPERRAEPAKNVDPGYNNEHGLSRARNRGAWLLILLFLGNGLADTSLKIYETSYSSVVGKELFMGGIFLTALLTGVLVLIRSGSFRFEKAEIRLGIFIGIPNLYASIFLIQALEQLPGALVYSTINLLIVLGATVLGVRRWGDRVTARQWAGITLTLVAIVLSVVSG